MARRGRMLLLCMAFAVLIGGVAAGGAYEEVMMPESPRSGEPGILQLWSEMEERFKAIDQLLSARAAKLDEREEKLDARAAQLKNQATQLEKQEGRLQVLTERVRDNTNDLTKRAEQLEEEHRKQIEEETRKSANTAAYSVGYHVQAGGMKGDSFAEVIGGIQKSSGVGERFVPAQVGAKYPVVIMLFNPPGCRLENGIVKPDEVTKCQEMLVPDGKLIFAMLRLGKDPTPCGSTWPDAEKVLEFAFDMNPLDPTKPKELSAASAMNRGSSAELASLAAKFVPDPPKIQNAVRFPWVDELRANAKALWTSSTSMAAALLARHVHGEL